MTAILAEIGDKMSGVGDWLAYGTVLAAVTFAVGCVRWWLMVLPVSFVMFFNVVTLREVFCEPFGQLIIDEMGWGYVVAAQIAFNAPVVLSVACAGLLRRTELAHRCQPAQKPAPRERSIRMNPRSPR